jgi:tungstate transport system permease protein
VELLWQGLVAGLRLILSGDPGLWAIVALSLIVSLSATAISAAIGIPLGARLALRGSGAITQALINTGMGLPPVVVGLAVSVLLWRTGPLGFLGLIYTPAAMVAAQVIVALPIAAGLTRAALDGLDPDLSSALRVAGAGEVRVGLELIRACLPQVIVAVSAAFGRAIAEVGASLMVGGNILNQTRVLTTAITLATSRGDFATAIGLGLILLALAFAVNAGLTWRARTAVAA